LNVLADKTNHMALRRSRRIVANPQPTLDSGQKPCIYKVGNTAENQDLPPEERLALYTFETDEYDPPAKKSRHKRNVRRRIKSDISDTMDDEYIPTTNVSKCLRPGTRIVTRQKKHLYTSVTKMALENEDTGPMAGSTLKCLNTGVSHHENLTQQKEDTVSVTGSSVQCLSPGVAYCDSDSQRETTTENKENIPAVDTSSACQVADVNHNERKSLVTENKAIISATSDRCVTVHQKHSICTNLADDSELNFSVAESEPGQVSSSSRSSLFISPVVRRFSQCVTMRRPRKSKDPHGIQSVEDFTIDNYFGFDEETDDDLDFSLSEVKVAPGMKPVMSVPFAVSSTPNPKPSFTRPEIKPLRLVQGRTRTRTACSSLQSAALLTAASVSGPKLFAPDTALPDTAEAAHSPCPSICMDEDVPVPHFTKPPRRSYERPLRLYQESDSDDSLGEDEASSKKRSKRSKKARMKEEKKLEKWAANVSAEFEEIDSFELCVE
jgi:hypothetical protein